VPIISKVHHGQAIQTLIVCENRSKIVRTAQSNIAVADMRRCVSFATF